MTDTAIAYIKQEIFTNAGAALQSLNYSIYQTANLERYFNVKLTKSFVEPPLAAPTPLTERRELAAALKYLEVNSNTGLLIIGLNHLSTQIEQRNEILDLCLKKGYRLLCGQPIIDLARPSDQQELRRNLQKVFR